MKIGEKLDELRNNILRDSSNLIAGDADTLWSDATLLRYIKQGERKFARQVMCLRDATTAPVTQVRLKSGVVSYPLHPSVFAVLSMRYDTDAYDIPRSGHGIVFQATPPDFLSFDPSAPSTLPPGKPVAYYTDETLVYATAGVVTLHVFPVPSSVEDGKTVYLRVLRTPLSAYTLEDLEKESEIPEDYELEPLQWAAHLATKNHDADAGSSTNSAKYKESFDLAVQAAIRETKRKLFAGMNFRFGMGGFSWTR